MADDGVFAANRRFVWSMVAAQFLIQIGAFSLPALLPTYISSWNLTKTEAGWLVGVFFGAYVVAVPILVALTDRVPARRIYTVGAVLTAVSHLGFALMADGFWSAFFLRVLAGIGWAAAYMPGLKAIADVTQGTTQSRAVSAHAAGVGVAGAVSFALAGALGATFGPSAAFVMGGLSALIALILALNCMPTTLPPHADERRGPLLDFRPVVCNRAAMGWIAGYTVHTWEMAAVRAWGVTFLGIAAAKAEAPGWLPTPTVVFTIAGLVGIAVSISGNEIAQRFGRLRLLTFAFVLSAISAVLIGFTVNHSPAGSAFLVVIWLGLIFLDSSALTAGTVQAADPKFRGATMGLHSMCGYAGGFFGPLGVGFCLDHAGADTVMGWALGFGHLAVVTLAGYALLRFLSAENPRFAKLRTTT